MIATWKKDGSETEEDWQFMFYKNGFMRQHIKGNKLSKGYVQRDGGTRLQFFEFAHECPISYYQLYDQATHADLTNCTDRTDIKDFPTVQVDGILKAEASHNVHLRVVKHSKSLMGFIENRDDFTNARNQHFIFGRLSDDKDSIVGVFLGEHASNYGVFYAKRIPSLQSYPIYDHINGATISYPYDTMTSQAKNFSYSMNGVIVDVIMENVDSVFAATKSIDYEHTITTVIIIQNESPYQVKLNKI